MGKIICFLMISLLAVPFIAAEDQTGLYNKIESALKPFIGQKVPMYGNERVNLYTMDKDPIGYAITSKGKFTEISTGELEDPTMNVYLENGDTVQTIMDAENPLDKFYELKGEGKIKIDPVGAGKSIKYFFTNIAGKVMSWFS